MNSLDPSYKTLFIWFIDEDGEDGKRYISDMSEREFLYWISQTKIVFKDFSNGTYGPLVNEEWPVSFKEFVQLMNHEFYEKFKVLF